MFSKSAAWLGSLMLFATAAFHATGLTRIKTAAAAPGLDPLLSSVLTPLWLFPTIHWAFIAAIAVIASVIGSRAILLAGSLIIAADAIMLFAYLGPFLGEAMLAAAAICFFIAAVLRRAPR
jgi:hypothetical protein